MFKDKIKELRVNNDLSLVQFAKMAGISKSTVILYEAGKQNPSRKTIAKICDAFDVTEEWLFEEEIAAAEEMEETEAVLETEEPEAAAEEETEEAEAEPEAEVDSKTEEPVTMPAEEPEAEEAPGPETAHTAAADKRKTKKPSKKPAASKMKKPSKKPAVSKTKGESKMSKKNTNKIVPPIPFPPNAKPFGKAGEQDDAKKAKADELKENYKELLKKYRQENIDARKTSVENGKDKQAQAFDRLMEMQETFAGFLSEDPFVLPFVPMFSIFPKKIVEQFMEIERLSNEFFKKQADAYADFCEQRKKMFQEMVTTAVTKNAESDSENEA